MAVAVTGGLVLLTFTLFWVLWAFLGMLVAGCEEVVALLGDQQVVGINERLGPLVGAAGKVVTEVSLECGEAFVVRVDDEHSSELTVAAAALMIVIRAAWNSGVWVLFDGR